MNAISGSHGERRALRCPLRIARLSRTLFVPYMQLLDHAIRSQETRDCSYAVQSLPHHLLPGSLDSAVLGRECPDRAFPGPDVALNLPSAPLLRDDLLRGNRDGVSRSMSSTPFASRSSCTVLIGATQVNPSSSRTSGAWLSCKRHQRIRRTPCKQTHLQQIDELPISHAHLVRVQDLCRSPATHCSYVIEPYKA